MKNFNRVLLIEESEADASFVRGLLAQNVGANECPSFEVEWVTDLEAARAVLGHREFDVCLVNQKVGSGRGLDLVEAGVAGHPPFILLSDVDSREIDLAAVKAGAMAFLLKNQLSAPLLERSIRYAMEWAGREKALERALHQSHVLATAVNNLTDGMIITDARQADNPIIFANAAFSAMTGYESAEVLGRNCRFLQGEATDASETAKLGRAVHAHEPFDGVILNYRKDGTPFWNNVKITPVLDGDGGVLNYVGLQTDVTARRQAALALRESEARKAAILDAAVDGIITIDHHNTVVEFNPAAERIFGYGRAQIVGRCVEELIFLPRSRPVPLHEETSPHEAFDDEAFDDEEFGGGAPGNESPGLGRHRNLLTRLFSYEKIRSGGQIELLGLRCDREEFPLELAISRIEVEGHPFFTGFVRDITQRKRAEASLRQSEANLRAAQSLARMGSWELELSESQECAPNTLHWSEEVARIFGCEGKPSEVSERDFFDAVHPGDRERVKKAVAHSLETGQPYGLDHRIVWPDGTERVVHGQALVERDEATGAPCKMVGTVQDITERKRAQALLEFQKTLLEAQTETSLDGILVVSDEGKILSYNRRLQAMWNLPDTPLDAGQFHFIARHAQQQVVNPQAFSERVAYLYAHRDEQSHDEISLLDGRIFDRYSAPITSAEGLYYGRVWYFRDITERKSAENALRATEERFQSIVANVPGMVYQLVMHPDGRMEWPLISEGCRDVYDAGPEALRNNPNWFHPCLFDEDRDEFLASVAESAQKLTPWGWEGRYRLVAGPSAGQTRWMQAASRPQRLPDGGTLWNGVVMDITARKEAEIERDRFFTLSLDMLGIANFDGHFKRLNPAFSQVLGFSEAELLARPFLEWVIPQDRARTHEALETLVRDGFIVDFENRCQNKEGEVRWLEWQAVATAESGVIYAAARDVTERKAGEVALLHLRDELETRVEARTAELEASNLELQIQIEEREQAERETRIRARQQESVAELGQRALLGVEMDVLLQGAASLVTTTLETDFSKILELVGDASQFVKRAASGSNSSTGVGQPVLVERTSLASYALKTGEPVVAPSLAQDERFQPSLFLRRQEIESAVCVVIGSAVQPYGVLVVGSRTPRAFTPNDVSYLQSVANVLATALSRNRTESEIRDLNEDLRQANTRLHLENLERQRALGALRETTETLQEAKDEAELAREDAELANRAKSEFLSRMSHELRTPLNAILGFGQILDRQELTPLQSESVGYILKGGRHLLALINEVLDIARVESGHIELSLEPIALHEVVHESCALVQPLAEQSNIRLKMDSEAENEAETHSETPRETLRYVQADRQRLKQVLINLLSNAIKYNRDGGEVRISIVPASQGAVQLRVTDSGWGLTHQDIQKLFTPFERLGAADSPVEGTGLGLMLSKRLIAAMSGTIGVESEPGRGTTFWVELPRAESPLQALMQGSQPFVAAALPAHGHTFTVLSIEDNLSNTRLLEAILEDRGDIRLLTATHGRMGLELAHGHHPDLILLDLHLPEMPGQEILQALQRAPDTQSIPVIVVSADATPSQIERLLAAGATRYLTKPLNVQEFLGALDAVLYPPPNPSHRPQGGG